MVDPVHPSRRPGSFFQSATPSSEPACLRRGIATLLHLCVATSPHRSSGLVPALALSISRPAPCHVTEKCTQRNVGSLGEDSQHAKPFLARYRSSIRSVRVCTLLPQDAVPMPPTRVRPLRVPAASRSLGHLPWMEDSIHVSECRRRKKRT